jgi:hypothetical protein
LVIVKPNLGKNGKPAHESTSILSRTAGYLAHIINNRICTDKILIVYVVLPNPKFRLESEQIIPDLKVIVIFRKI